VAKVDTVGGGRRVLDWGVEFHAAQDTDIDMREEKECGGVPLFYCPIQYVLVSLSVDNNFLPLIWSFGRCRDGIQFLTVLCIFFLIHISTIYDT